MSVVLSPDASVWSGPNDGLYRYAPYLRNKWLLKVSMFGDSITLGSFNYPGRPDIWTPERTMNYLAADASYTVTTGNDLFNASVQAGQVVVSGGVVANGNQYTMTADAVNTAPRFAMNPPSQLFAVAAGEFWRVQAQVNSTSNPNSLYFRLMQYNASNTMLVEATGPWWQTTTGSLITYSFVMSIDVLLLSQATLAKMVIGGRIAGGGASMTGVMQNVAVQKLTKGCYVRNQGVNGENSGQALARIADVTAWSPDMCIIGEGTNDIRTAGNINDLLVTYLANLTAICASLKAAGCYPVLATLPPLAASQPNYDYVPAWNARIKTLARALEVGLWDRWSALNFGDLTYIEDGRHPTATGYDKLAQSAASVLSSKSQTW